MASIGVRELRDESSRRLVAGAHDAGVQLCEAHRRPLPHPAASVVLCPNAPTAGRPGRGRRAPDRRQREPDLIDEVAAALATGEPLDLPALASTLLSATAPREHSPFDPPDEPGLPSREEIVQTASARGTSR